MTSPAIKLARECFPEDYRYDIYDLYITLKTQELEIFYSKAQAQALRDAADLVQDDYGCDVDSAAKLRRRADELEKQK